MSHSRPDLVQVIEYLQQHPKLRLTFNHFEINEDFLAAACGSGRWDVVEWVLQRFPTASFNDPDLLGNAATQKNISLEFLEKLRSKGAPWGHFGRLAIRSGNQCGPPSPSL